MQRFSQSFCFFSLICFAQLGFANPWFTGPILAPAGHVVPKGHTNFEFYGLDVRSTGHYDDHGHLIRSPLFESFVANPILTHGFTDWLDIQLTVPYTFNETLNVAYHRLADVSVAAGIQLLEQGTSTRKPDIRLLIVETFPTGQYQRLKPRFLGTDSTGLGTYETQVGIDFQYLANVYKEHYLRTRLILAHIFTTAVDVTGLNSYGGTPFTNGTIRAGGQSTLDLAFEYTLTQNWVAVMEGYVTKGNETRFDGDIDIGNLGSPAASIGNGAFHQVGLVPALEYNFNPNVGLIGGVWFPVVGKNTSYFNTYVLALNMFW